MIPSSYDPMSLEVCPGLKVGDLKTPEACTAAIMRLEDEMATIRAQIASAEENPAGREPGWRTRAQNAISWKKRVRRAVMTHAATLRVARPAPSEKRQAILDTIQAELGEGDFARLVALARERHPHLWTETSA